MSDFRKLFNSEMLCLSNWKKENFTIDGIQEGPHSLFSLFSVYPCKLSYKKETQFTRNDPWSCVHGELVKTEEVLGGRRGRERGI